MRLYSMLDRKMKEFGAVMIAQNDEVMIRTLKDSLPSGSIVASHPEDFDLFFLGAMAMETGVIASSSPTLVAGMSSVLNVDVPFAGGLDGSR